MPINRADRAVRLAMSDILSKFLRRDERIDNSLPTLTEQVYNMGGISPVPGYTLRGLLCDNDELHLRDNGRFLFLEPVAEEGILPLLTLETSKGWINFRAYVLLTMLDHCDALQALAIRFETDEGSSQANSTPGSHDFCHAQLCRSIGAMHASTPTWIPESQPSFPLDAEDQIGLVLCMLISLYGGRHVVERLNTSGDRDLTKYLVKVRALRRESP